MKRRTKWILGLGIGIPIVLVAALVLTLWILSPDVNQTLSAIERKELPNEWAEPGPPPEPVDETIPTEPAQPTIETLGFPIEGTLVILGDGRPFGEETYRFELEDNGVALSATGKFWFKALVATISINFEQTLTLDQKMNPVTLRSMFDGPLGFDRRIDVDVNEARAVVHVNDDTRTYDVSDRLFLVGTFSTYAAVPILYELGELDGDTAYQTLMLGGPSDRVGSVLPVMRVKKVSDVTIESGNTTLTVDRYLVSSEMGTMTLFAKGNEFLGLQAGEDDESLFVYRGDYFDGGFETVTSSVSTSQENGKVDESPSP